jgi:putative flippase GtrA
VISFIKKPNERIRFLRFAVVGTIGAMVDFLVFNQLNSTFNIAAVIASMLSFLAALTSNFILNRYWTYPDSRSKSLKSQLAQYGLVNLVGLAIRTPVFLFAANSFATLIGAMDNPLSLDPTLLAHNLALATAIVVVLFWNFFVNRYWTYSDVK